MPKAVDIEEFSTKLGFLCKRLNWSRGKLAQQVGVDKSLVGRWLTATSRPTGNSLMLLNEALKKAIPGFTAASWDMSSTALARWLGIVPPAEPAGKPPQPSLGVAGTPRATPHTAADVQAGMRAFQRHASDIDALAKIYAGFYRFWFPELTNNGAIRHGAARFWREGDALRVETSHYVTNFTGIGVSVGERLYLIMEAPIFDGLSLTALGGPRGRHPVWLTGVSSFHRNLRSSGFVAAPIVFHFDHPATADREADERKWQELQAEIAARDSDDASVPKRVSTLLRRSLGRADGSADDVLIVPALD